MGPISSTALPRETGLFSPTGLLRERGPFSPTSLLREMAFHTSVSPPYVAQVSPFGGAGPTFQWRRSEKRAKTCTANLFLTLYSGAGPPSQWRRSEKRAKTCTANLFLTLYSGAGPPSQWRRSEKRTETCTANLFLTLYSGAGPPYKIRPAPLTHRTCTTKKKDLRHGEWKPAPRIESRMTEIVGQVTEIVGQVTEIIGWAPGIESRMTERKAGGQRGIGHNSKSGSARPAGGSGAADTSGFCSVAVRRRRVCSTTASV